MVVLHGLDAGGSSVLVGDLVVVLLMAPSGSSSVVLGWAWSSMVAVLGGVFTAKALDLLAACLVSWDATICFLFFWSAVCLADVELVVAWYFLAAEVLVATIVPLGEQWE